MQEKKNYIFGFLSLFLTFLVTFKTWTFELFSDDWIWFLFSQRFRIVDFFQIFEMRFAGFWRPSMTFWFWLTRCFTNANPLVQHILSFLFLSLIAYIAARLVYKISQNFLAAVIVIVLIVLNSSGSEVWLWYSAVGDLLLTFFILLNLYFLNKDSDKISVIVFLVSLIGALLSKETAVIFPFLLLFWPPMSIVYKQKKNRYLFSLAIVSLVYYTVQFKIGLNRNEPLSYSIDRIIVWFNSWLQALVPQLGQTLIKDNFFKYVGLFLGLAIFALCLLLYKKFKDEKKVLVWFVLTSFLILLPTTILSIPAGRLLASRYLFSSGVFLAIAAGLLFSRIAQRKFKYLFLFLVIIWSVFSLLSLKDKIIIEYAPINQFMRPLMASLKQEIAQTKEGGSIYIFCSFPFDHNEGYLKALAEVQFNFSEHRVLIMKDQLPQKKHNSDRLIAWDYNKNKFLEVADKESAGFCDRFLKK